MSVFIYSGEERSRTCPRPVFREVPHAGRAGSSVENQEEPPARSDAFWTTSLDSVALRFCMRHVCLPARLGMRLQMTGPRFHYNVGNLSLQERPSGDGNHITRTMRTRATRNPNNASETMTRPPLDDKEFDPCACRIKGFNFKGNDTALFRV